MAESVKTTQRESDRPVFAVWLSPARAGMPDNPTPEEAEAVSAHFAYYQRLLADGVLLLAGRTLNPPHRGMMLFEANGLDAAEQLVRSDPGVAAGVFEARVQPFRIALQRG